MCFFITSKATKVGLIGMLIVLMQQVANAQVDSSIFIYKKNQSRHLTSLLNSDSIQAGIKSGVNIRICTPSRQNLLNPPLFVVIASIQSFYFKDTGTIKLAAINPQWINSINIIKGQQALDAYGNLGKNGAIEIILNDEKYPNAYQSIQAVIKKTQP